MLLIPVLFGFWVFWVLFFLIFLNLPLGCLQNIFSGSGENAEF